jgi:DNA topoisomerase II
MASELQLQHERLSNQARFVRMIVERLLNVSNRKKADIVEDLRKKDFRPFPKVTKAKVAGETAPVVDPEDEDAAEDGPANINDYDYLLGMPIWNLTKEKVRYPCECLFFGV